MGQGNNYSIIICYTHAHQSSLLQIHVLLEHTGIWHQLHLNAYLVLQTQIDVRSMSQSVLVY